MTTSSAVGQHSAGGKLCYCQLNTKDVETGKVHSEAVREEGRHEFGGECQDFYGTMNDEGRKIVDMMERMKEARPEAAQVESKCSTLGGEKNSV